MPYLLTGRALQSRRNVETKPVPTATFSKHRSCFRMSLQHPLLVLVQQIDGPFWGMCQVGAAIQDSDEPATIDLFEVQKLEDAMLWLQRQWLDVGLTGADFKATLFEVVDDVELDSQLGQAASQLQQLGVKRIQQHGLLMVGQQVTLDLKHEQFYLDWWHGDYIGGQPCVGH